MLPIWWLERLPGNVGGNEALVLNAVLVGVPKCDEEQFPPNGVQVGTVKDLPFRQPAVQLQADSLVAALRHGLDPIDGNGRSEYFGKGLRSAFVADGGSESFGGDFGSFFG